MSEIESMMGSDFEIMDKTQFDTRRKDLQMKLDVLKQCLEMLTKELNDLILCIANNDSSQIEWSNLRKDLQMQLEGQKQSLESMIKWINDTIPTLATIDSSKLEWSNIKETISQGTQCTEANDAPVADE